ncbi:hypothetical protein ACOMHN_026127 [Nucella lapillus]
MRKIRLTDTDGALFDEEMIPQDYEYLAKHKATFCRMWNDQGSKFWRRYVEVFRSYILRYSLLGDLTCDASQLQGTLEFAFVVITTQFIEGKVNQAKSLLNQIADLGKNRHRCIHLDSKSVIKDPFYTKETRDIFREFFGPANEKSSYIKVYLLTPVYMKFGGSIVRCLTKWMEAEEISPDDDSYFVRPTPIEINTPLCPKHPRCTPSPPPSAVLCAYHLDDCTRKFSLQFLKGVPSSPVDLGFWEKKDPRFCYPENPLWNPGAGTNSDWRTGLTIEKFREFYAWCSFSDDIMRKEDQCQDCRARKKSKKKNKRKKKKGASNVPDIVYEDISLALDSAYPWGHLDAEMTSKVVAMAKVYDGTCLHNGKVSAPDLDSTQPLLIRQMKQYKALMGEMDPEFEVVDKIQTVPGNMPLHCTRHADCQCRMCVFWREIAAELEEESDSSDSETYPNDMSKAANKLLSLKFDALSSGVIMGRRSSGDGEMGELLGQRVVFGKETVTTKTREAMKLPVSKRQGDLRALFDVQFRTDPEHHTKETAVTLMDVAVSPGMAPMNPDITTSPLCVHTIETLTIHFLETEVKGLPATLCAEGRDWCLVEVDYGTGAERERAEDDGEKATHFSLKLTNPGISCARGITVLKRIMLRLLTYVVSRKKRPSPGWVLNNEDIFVFLQTLGKDNYHVRGTTFRIVTGCCGYDVLTREEVMQSLQTTSPYMRTTQAHVLQAYEDIKAEIAEITKISDTRPSAVSGKPVTNQTSAPLTMQKKKSRDKGEENKPEAASSGVDNRPVEDSEDIASKAQGVKGVDNSSQPGNTEATADRATTASAPSNTTATQNCNNSSAKPTDTQAEKKERKETDAEKRERKETDAEKKERKETDAEKKERKETDAQAEKKERKETDAEKRERKETDAEKKERKETDAEKKERKETDAEKKERKETDAEKKERKETDAEKRERKETDAEKRERKETDAEKRERKETDAEKKERKETDAEKKERKETDAEKRERKETDAEKRERKETDAEKKERKETDAEKKERKETDAEKKERKESDAEKKERKETDAEKKERKETDAQAEKKERKETDAETRERKETDAQAEKRERKETDAEKRERKETDAEKRERKETDAEKRERKETDAEKRERKETDAEKKERKETDAEKRERKETDAEKKERKETDAEKKERKETDAEKKERKETDTQAEKKERKETDAEKRERKETDAQAEKKGKKDKKSKEKRPRRLSDIDTDTDSEVEAQMEEQYGGRLYRHECGAGGARTTGGDTRDLRPCSNCGFTEPIPRFFQKCGRCKEENVSEPRFYCKEPCQHAHWHSQHHQEHDQKAC